MTNYNPPTMPQCHSRRQDDAGAEPEIDPRRVLCAGADTEVDGREGGGESDPGGRRGSCLIVNSSLYWRCYTNQTTERILHREAGPEPPCAGFIGSVRVATPSRLATQGGAHVPSLFPRHRLRLARPAPITHWTTAPLPYWSRGACVWGRPVRLLSAGDKDCLLDISP